MTSVNSNIVYLRTLFLASERIRGDDSQLVDGLSLIFNLGLIGQTTLDSIRDRLKIA